jgi:hypothetical protein
MGFEAKKTEHSGPKCGHGAYWGYKWEAKKESNRIRRENAKREIRGATDVMPEESIGPRRRRPFWVGVSPLQPREGVDEGTMSVPFSQCVEIEPFGGALGAAAGHSRADG